jgi:hypothetical protein
MHLTRIATLTVLSGIALSLLPATADAADATTQPQSYNTLCVSETLANGQKAPEVCVYKPV